MKTKINLPSSTTRVIFIVVLIIIWVGLLAAKVQDTNHLIEVLQLLIIGSGGAHLALTNPAAETPPSLPLMRGMSITMLPDPTSPTDAPKSPVSQADVSVRSQDVHLKTGESGPTVVIDPVVPTHTDPSPRSTAKPEEEHKPPML